MERGIVALAFAVGVIVDVAASRRRVRLRFATPLVAPADPVACDEIRRIVDSRLDELARMRR